MASNVADIRIESLRRRAPLAPLALSQGDCDYVLRNLDVIGEAFEVDARPPAPLALIPARSLVQHLGHLRATLVADGLERRLARGRLESVLRLVETAVALLERGGRRSA